MNTQQKLERALQTVYDLCSGKLKWIMSVPARPDEDPDLVIADALRQAQLDLTVMDGSTREIARLAIQANHQHHQDHDEYGGYPDSSLEEQNTDALRALSLTPPIDMVLLCPVCGEQHVDAPEKKVKRLGPPPRPLWTNPPHCSHLCHKCGCIWRPAGVATNGVKEIKTKGKADMDLINIRYEHAKRAI